MGATSTTNGYSRSKARPGLVEKIISEMPRHDFYIEGFAGRAAVFHQKLPAAFSYLIDVDSARCQIARSEIAGSRAKVIHGDVLEKVPGLPNASEPTKTLAYFDPPRLLARPKDKFNSAEFHEAFLDMVLKLSCRVMVNGLPSDLYFRKLTNWRRIDIRYVNHREHLECLWCSFPKEEFLHDPRFVGRDFREREKIKRRQQRWQRRFREFKPSEQQAMVFALAEVNLDSVKGGLDSFTAGTMPTISVRSR